MSVVSKSQICSILSLRNERRNNLQVFFIRYRLTLFILTIKPILCDNETNKMVNLSEFNMIFTFISLHFKQFYEGEKLKLNLFYFFLNYDLVGNFELCISYFERKIPDESIHCDMNQSGANVNEIFCLQCWPFQCLHFIHKLNACFSYLHSIEYSLLAVFLIGWANVCELEKNNLHIYPFISCISDYFVWYGMT